MLSQEMIECLKGILRENDEITVREAYWDLHQMGWRDHDLSFMEMFACCFAASTPLKIALKTEANAS